MEIHRQANASAVLKVRDEIVRKEIGDLYVLLDLRSGVFYTLNETASLVWKLIEEQTMIEEIAVHIAQQYDISQDEVLQDLAAFIDSLVQEQLLIGQHLQGDSAPAK